VAYCGLKIITSLSLRFPDFQRWTTGKTEKSGRPIGWRKNKIQE